MQTKHLFAGLFVAALMGVIFAGFSTYDFARHLDRQVHSVHCSFVPGLGDTNAAGTSGCMATMMSPYSSVGRDGMWAGVPVSLPGLSVFAFLLFFVAELWFANRRTDRRALGFLVLATAVPLLTSIAMGYISFVTLGTACKMCIGIYAASALSFLFAFILWRRAPWQSQFDVGDDDDDDDEISLAPRKPAPASNGYLAGAFGLGVLFVADPDAVSQNATLSSPQG